MTCEAKRTHTEILLRSGLAWGSPSELKCVMCSTTYMRTVTDTPRYAVAGVRAETTEAHALAEWTAGMCRVAYCACCMLISTYSSAVPQLESNMAMYSPARAITRWNNHTRRGTLPALGDALARDLSYSSAKQRRSVQQTSVREDMRCIIVVLVLDHQAGCGGEYAAHAFRDQMTSPHSQLVVWTGEIESYLRWAAELLWACRHRQSRFHARRETWPAHSIHCLRMTRVLSGA